MTSGFARTRFYATRPRKVPPEFCSDDLLEACSLLAALLLYRVISQADDQGRLPGHPKYVKGVCFAMRPSITEKKVAAAIDELVEAGFLIRYLADGRVFLQIDRWQDLQGKWGRRAYPSRYPEPPGWMEDWVYVTSDETDAPKLRAPNAQDERDLHAPIPFAVPFTVATPTTALSSTAAAERDLSHVNRAFERATGSRMTDSEDPDLGMSLVDNAAPGSRVA